MGWLRYLPEPQSSPIMLLQSNLVKNNPAYPYEQPQQIKFMAGSLYSSPTLSGLNPPFVDIAIKKDNCHMVRLLESGFFLNPPTGFGFPVIGGL